MGAIRFCPYAFTQRCLHLRVFTIFLVCCPGGCGCWCRSWFLSASNTRSVCVVRESLNHHVSARAALLISRASSIKRVCLDLPAKNMMRGRDDIWLKRMKRMSLSLVSWTCGKKNLPNEKTIHGGFLVAIPPKANAGSLRPFDRARVQFCPRAKVRRPLRHVQLEPTG